MSLKNNIVASYASQIYAVLAGIVMVPIYIRYMGTEAYGLVGFYTMLYLWFQLLDMGLSTTMIRETARFTAGAASAKDIRQLMRGMEGVFVGIAIAGASAMLISSEAIATKWLNVQPQSVQDVHHSIMLIAAVMALRLMSSLYRGIIYGFERIVWLSGATIGIASLRFIFVIPVFLLIGTSPVVFFWYQLLVAVAELLCLSVKAYRLMPKMESGSQVSWQLAPLRRVFRFSVAISLSGVLWIIVTQTDKLVLSKLLTLEEYAYFTLAVIVASGIMIVSTPITNALVPRLSNLMAAGDEEGMIRLYRRASQLMGMITVPVSIALAFFSYQILWAWTGSADIAAKAAPVLTLYALGNGISAFAFFPYQLQFAKGDLRLNVMGNLLFLAFLLPVLVWATGRYGAVGGGYAWLGCNIVYFLVWAPIVHRRFAKGLHLKWLLQDVSPALVVTLAFASMISGLINWDYERMTVVMLIAVLGLSLLAISVAGTGMAREAIAMKLKAKFAR